MAEADPDTNPPEKLGRLLDREMRGHQTDELARGDDLGIFPEAREMALVAVIR
jgi:hypothetical protein